MKKEPLVSIITPLYNAEKYISNTIESVINQEYNNWELIIINDCSKDKGPEIIKKYQNQDKRIKLINLEKNSGAAVARNVGIENAKGNFIAFIDSDDIWEKTKLKEQISFMLENNYNFSYTDYIQIDEKGNELRKIRTPKILTYKKQLLYNHIGTSTVIYNQKNLGKIFMPDLRKRQDYAMWLKILKNHSKGYGLNKVLTKYIIRNDSISSNKMDLIKYNWEMYRKSEEFGVIKSSFYLFTDIMSKILKIK
ncbi:MAG: teichuronic acid biosynthesis glycosyltransferase TuaG [Oceanotoga sp.]|uniref:glycosyltransferase family 2 protein n=1 Tax=Oceanotoga sp. TaxID=2108366 RepID=UPI00264C592F|nr:glycosyltransferase family 2 protein [Oceanotoga sp.]MDN5341379.1 teichuronic acid biosynthesis glycosyltransferase TuaG [Oceanotoga sp.]